MLRRSLNSSNKSTIRAAVTSRSFVSSKQQHHHFHSNSKNNTNLFLINASASATFAAQHCHSLSINHSSSSFCTQTSILKFNTTSTLLAQVKHCFMQQHKRPNNNLLENKKYELEPEQKIQKRMASTNQQQQEQQKDYHKFNMWRVDSMYNPAVSYNRQQLHHFLNFLFLFYNNNLNIIYSTLLAIHSFSISNLPIKI